MKRKQLWNVILVLIWLLQLAAEVLLVTQICRLDILPNIYVFAISMLMFVLSFISGALIFTAARKVEHKNGESGKTKRRNRKVFYKRQFVAIVIAVAVALVDLYGAQAVSSVNDTMTTIAAGEKSEVTTLIGVYVLADDSAVSIADAANYDFVTYDAMNSTELDEALTDIDQNVGKTVTPQSAATLIDAVESLYDQSAQALIADEAYASILEDNETYADFSEKTKLLYEISVTKVSKTYTASRKTESTDTDANASDDSNESTSDISVDPFIMYISGSDTRSTMLTTSRSDVNIIAVVNPSTKQVLLINTPRDYYIANPAGNGALDKLTHCGVYGIDCSMAALSDLYEEDIEHYVQINFTGFEKLIDSIGGITVYSDVAFTTLHGSYNIHVGDNTLNGDEALGFARERYSLSGGDNDRGQNQMKVITAVIKKLTSGSTFSTYLTNYQDILDSMEGMFITDLDSNDISKLIKAQLQSGTQWNVVSYAVTGTGGSSTTTYSMPGHNLYVMYPNESSVAKAQDLINRVYAGERIDASDAE